MLIDKLYDLRDNNLFEFSGIKHLDTLIEAINDWPETPLSFDDYLKQLYRFFNRKSITISVICDATKKLNPNRQAWEMESFTSLYRFMYMNSSESLVELFENLEKHLSEDN